MRGFLTIKKVYEDRVEDVRIERDNTITDGFGIAITNLLTSSPDRKMRDFQLGYWQAGSGTHYDTENYSEAQPDSIRNALYELASPVSSVDGYGIESIIRADDGVAITVEEKWLPDTEIVYTTSGGVFAKLPPQNVTTIEGDAIRVKLTIDREGLVGETLREFGLYMNNPEGYQDDDRCILAAYKVLMDPIEKTNEFSIDLEWVIDFSNGDFFSDKIGESMYFVPTVKGVEPGDQYTTSLSATGRFTPRVESLNPVATSGTLVFGLGGDAVSGTHYVLTSSSLEWTQGEQLKSVTVINTGTGWFTPKTLRLSLSSFDGDKTIADSFIHGKPSYLDIVLTSPESAPQLEFDSAVIPDTTQTILLDSSSTEPLTVYFDVSAEAGGTYTGPTSVTIPSGVTSHDFTVTATAGFDYIVSAHNGFGTSNRVGNSTNFEVNTPEPLLGYADVSSSPEDFDSPNDRRYRNFIGAPTYYHVGNQRTKDYQTTTSYTVEPPQRFLLNTQDDDGPLPYGGSQIVYVPKEYYVWPGSDYAAPYITESRIPTQVDGVGRSSEMQVDRYPYTLSAGTAFTLGMFVKDFGTATIPGASDDDDTINSSRYFSMEIAFSNGSHARGTWEWDSGLTLYSVSQDGLVFANTIEDVGDGWWRVTMRITGTSEEVGSEMSYKIYPHHLDSGITVDSSAPLDVSGTMMAGLMLEEGSSTPDYAPQIDCFGTPIGGVRVNSGGQTETRFTL